MHSREAGRRALRDHTRCLSNDGSYRLTTTETTLDAPSNLFHGAVDADDYRMRRTADEFYRRSIRGSLYYAFSFSLVDSIARFDRVSMWLLTLPLAVFIGSIWLRARHRPPGPAAGKKDYELWVRRHWQLIHLSLLLWGMTVAAVGWRQAHPDSATMIATVCTVAHANRAEPCLCDVSNTGQARHHRSDCAGARWSSSFRASIYGRPGLRCRYISFT